ncbi:sulfate transporter CysZ [Kangiella profundi]|uniref:Sulfate transporter CysZ n=1 Tax=Kangiella profundi TaxID=1561924 RepID=A0A2K9AY21_9GAMM|nr:sulfate transporter CysZ [Kangiella profundi]AUD78749.1 sulfate transporter CysZ [Kangiella profundi]GGF04523.1 sulfate transporter CysZ [Kangiella profundi]
MAQNTFHGAHYLADGFRMLTQKGIKRYVLIPLAINLILLSTALILLVSQVSSWSQWVEQTIASWGAWEWLGTALAWLMWPVVILGGILFIFFFFAMLANWIAAPFNGLLAEAVENKLHTTAGYDEKVLPEQGFWALVKDIPRLFGREWIKLKYYIPRALVCLLILFIPLIGALAFPIIWFIFNAWMMSVQYVDYPMDNHKIPFQDMLKALQQKRGGTFGFGAMVMLMTMIPFINLLVMPAAVCGATKMWYEHYRKDMLGSQSIKEYR